MVAALQKIRSDNGQTKEACVMEKYDSRRASANAGLLDSPLLESEVVLPVQFILRGESAQSGECRLMVAVLEDAVACYRRYAFAEDRMGAHNFAEVAAWIRDEDWNWPFSFVNICAVLGLDHSAIRNRLRRWRRTA